MGRSTGWTIGLCALALLLACGSMSAQIPQRMNYQVMLTNDADEPLANESVQLVFRIYNVEAGGGQLWTETHNVITNSVGVVSVVLGSTNPLSIDFDGPLWLQVSVDGEILSPRRELTSAPYSLAVQNAGSGDGHSLDAADGSPTDVLYVDNDGLVTVGALVPLNGTQKVSVFGEQDQTAGYFMANSDNVYGVGLFGRSDLSGGVVGNAGTTGDYYPSNETGVTGVADEGADAALFVAFGDGKGVWTQSEGAGDALRAYAGGTGRSGYFSGGTGVDMSLNNGDMVYPVLDITNYENSWYGDCLHLQSQPNVHAGTTTLRSHCYRGRAGHFEKDTAGDGYYAVTIYSPTVSSAGLYVFGYIYATSAMAREVETSRGKEAVFSMSSPEVEMVSSGQGRLSGGTARVDFDRTFAESITNPSDLRITATPVGGWSALYIDRIDADGFDLRSDSGRTDVGFHWVAIGRAEDYERKPEIVTPDHDEEMRIQQLKDEELRARRPPTERPKRPAVVSAQDG